MSVLQQTNLSDLLNCGPQSNLLPPEGIKHRIYSPDDKVSLEDESGRLRLVGKLLKHAMLVTGVIVGVLGQETDKGEFEVLDLCYAGMVAQDTEDKEGDLDQDKMVVDGELYSLFLYFHFD